MFKTSNPLRAKSPIIPNEEKKPHLRLFLYIFLSSNELFFLLIKKVGIEIVKEIAKNNRIRKIAILNLDSVGSDIKILLLHRTHNPIEINMIV